MVPIVNENDTVATHEIRFGDNDRLAALVAHLVGADALVLLSDVDALYTRHPAEPGRRADRSRSPTSKTWSSTPRAGAEVGTGGMATKLEAARIATHAGVDRWCWPRPRTSAAALAGEPVGTLFHPTGKRRSRRLLWLAYASKAAGVLTLDTGAVRAVVERKASLLPAGVVAVTGTFDAGDPVRLVDPGRRSSPAAWSTTTPTNCPA